MNTYNWIISALECKVNGEDDLKNVVYTVHWRYNATNENEITVDTYGAQIVGSPDPAVFTPYADITKAQVVAWLEILIDVPAMNEALDARILLIENPVDVTLPPPFEN